VHSVQQGRRLASLVIQYLENYLDQLIDETIANVSRLNRENGNIRSEINNLTAYANENMHIETGFINCGDSLNWPGHADQRIHTDKGVQFQRPYKRPPFVQLSVTDYYQLKRFDSYFIVKVLNQTTEGFTIRCRVFDTLRIIRLRVSWISFPGPFDSSSSSF
jgi:hypothetical protein